MTLSSSTQVQYQTIALETCLHFGVKQDFISHNTEYEYSAPKSMGNLTTTVFWVKLQYQFPPQVTMQSGIISNILAQKSASTMKGQDACILCIILLLSHRLNGFPNITCTPSGGRYLCASSRQTFYVALRTLPTQDFLCGDCT